MPARIYGLPKDAICAILSLTKNPSSPSRKTMLKTNLIALAAILMLVANASLFAMDMRQDGVVTSTMMMQLRPGVTKAQVLSIMGKPLTANENLANRWDYTYQKWHEGQLIEQRRVTLEFENDTLTRIQSELIPVDNSIISEQPPAVAALPAGPDLKLEHRLQLPYVPDETMEEAHPEPGTIVVEGDKMDFYLERKMRSFGNASIKKEGQAIYGDKIEYDVLNDELHVVGNTRIEFEGLKVWGPELRMHLYDTVGEMQQPSFELETRIIDIPQISTASTRNTLDQNYLDDDQLSSDNIDDLLSDEIENLATHESTSRKEQSKSRGDAKVALFEGEHKKVLKSARYTTCEVDQDDWYIKASDLEIDTYTKRATALNARVEFMGVPLLYTPWIDFSYLNQRKSGLLSPTIGTTSRSGFEVQVPYYWNISPEMDATFGVRALSKRGVQLQGEFRYLNENFSGVNNAEYLPSDSITKEDRYYVNLSHRHRFGNGWSAGYNYEKVSDDEYFSELDTAITATSRVNLLQRAFVNYRDEIWNFRGLVQRYQTLNDSIGPYKKLPELTLTGDKDWDLIRTDLYTQWVSFDRNRDRDELTITRRDVTGNRFTLNPSISVPFERPYGYITPKLGVHYTSYDLSNENYIQDGEARSYDAPDRTLPIFSLDSGLYFDRDVKVVNNRYTQTLEPRLFYVYIPYKDQSMYPVFDTSEGDLNLGSLFLENQFRGNDRVNDANQISLALTTRMIDANTGQQRLAAMIGQRFYFSDQKVTLSPDTPPRTDNSSDIVAAVTAKLVNNWNVDAGWQYNTGRSTTVKSNIGARYNPEPGKVLNLSYRYSEGGLLRQSLCDFNDECVEDLEQINISGQWPLGGGWYGMGRWNYSISENQPIEGLAGIEYDAGCWQARTVLQRVSTATAEANYALYFQLELGGLTSIGSNPMRLLERSIPGYSPSGEITNSYDPINE
ncbi:MAG: LPS-assembly protein LptD [Betaproteobacteria bacterium HGW-Betaproteobacteria-2]|nr:MAG: LPS-assembly protein LptD [Betaproteobacteria bacterium HGW-Betaproteobacteria-2]